MNCLGIDPGTIETAFVVWNGKEIVEADTKPNHIVLHYLLSYRADPLSICAIEMVESYGMAVGREVFETVVWIGRFMQQWKIYQGDQPIELVYRRHIKTHHCHDTKAKDTNIRQALMDKYGAPGVKKSPGVTYGLVKHEWSAFAIATYVLERDEMRREAKRQQPELLPEPLSTPLP